jgi:HTH-type transcriptional regulator/antitoxin HipB
VTRLSLNAVEPCGTRSARVNHAAHGEACSVCDPLLERPGVCPSCGDRVTILGDKYMPHRAEGVDHWRCDGSGASARPLTPIAHTLRTKRLELGLTQAQMAERAGVRQGLVASLEAGVSPLRVPTLAAVAASVGYRLTVIPDGEE